MNRSTDATDVNHVGWVERDGFSIGVGRLNGGNVNVVELPGIWLNP